MLVAQQPDPVFKSDTNLVVVNVFVRGKDGKTVSDLKREDFVLLEDGRPQAVSVFEFTRLDEAPTTVTPAGPQPPATPATEVAVAPAPPPTQATGSRRYKDRRLLILFFDMSSMQPPEQLRSLESAEKFIRDQMTPADLVSIETFSNSLKVVQEFTSDRDLLFTALKRFRVGEGSELAEVAEVEGDESDNAAFMADDSEFNMFNTDRKLSALEGAAKALSALPEKKALIYFSSGVGRTGAENESQLRSTINAAVKANVSFYPVDARGLVALPPGGDASQGASSGSGLFSGRTQRGGRDRLANQQETLYSLAEDTGGKALIDSNDLVSGIRQAQTDISSYYILGYYSVNVAKDGRFRKVEVKFSRPIANANIEYRAGYYAEKQFKAFSSSEKEKQLEDALLLGDPLTQLPLALEVNWFRLSRDRYFVPVSVKIPGSAVPFRNKGGRDTTQFDFIGEIRDEKNTRVSAVRDVIDVKLPESGDKSRRSLLYETGFTLGSGTYKLKLLARENQTGQMGTFETRFTIPAEPVASTAPLVSTVVFSSQRESIEATVGAASKKAAKQLRNHPLVVGKQKLVPSVTRVFRRDQPLYIYCEVYEPTVPREGKAPSVAATISFFRGGEKVYETSAIRVTELLKDRNRALAIEARTSLRDLKPGDYTAQVNLIDEPGRRFVLLRSPLVIRGK